jgi:short-chain fatty acids transporter
MSFARRFEKAFHYLLPAPFTIAVILTIIVMIMALIFGDMPGDTPRLVSLLNQWQAGLWNAPLLVFALQMMLILVLGHTLALSPAISRFINRVTGWTDNPSLATFLVCFFTLLVALFNWGLGLIFGAIMARKTGEHFAGIGKKINYPLLGAAGYSGLMVWHGGISGSAPIKVAESGHLVQLMSGFWNADQLSSLPDTIPMQATVFSSMNLTTSVILLIALPLSLAIMARFKGGHAATPLAKPLQVDIENEGLSGAEKLDSSTWFALSFSGLILGYAIYVAMSSPDGLSFLTLNYVNLTLLGLAIAFHGSFKKFVHAVEQAISGAAGILIQFPLYFGIMGIMASSGLIVMISDFFISISGPTSFPIFTFFSAGLVNIFVPSGGGQWAVQGPIIIEAASRLNLNLPECIMALAYGDQLTNMLQPFWALPLLGITGLKAREILPYTLILLIIGAIIFLSMLLVF